MVGQALAIHQGPALRGPPRPRAEELVSATAREAELGSWVRSGRWEALGGWEQEMGPGKDTLSFPTFRPCFPLFIEFVKNLPRMLGQGPPPPGATMHNNLLCL